MNKLLYVCLDGLGDDPIPEFGGRRPLEAAARPNLDGWPAAAAQGMVYTVGPDIAPESDIAVFAILGLRPAGRSTRAEACWRRWAAGMDFRDGDLAYRINFATQEDGEIVDRRVGRDLPSEDSAALAEEVNRGLVLPGATFELRATIEHRGAVVSALHRGAAVGEVTQHRSRLRQGGHLGVALETFENRVAEARPVQETEEARRAADLTNAWVHGAAEILERSEVNARRRREGRLPANLILTRDGGDRIPRLQPIRDRFGPEWGVFVEMPVERGIGMALGMDPGARSHRPSAPRAVRGLGGARRRGPGGLRRPVHPHQGPGRARPRRSGRGKA